MYINLKELYENDPKNYDKNCKDICKKLVSQDPKEKIKAQFDLMAYENKRFLKE